mmetsp:Transcript_23214/g.63740  ORF Transcript_23214/g.63740 Transcript_23214/m.63740 type:complete len:87 (-) Transcript_23214:2732-2992(-)
MPPLRQMTSRPVHVALDVALEAKLKRKEGGGEDIIHAEPDRQVHTLAAMGPSSAIRSTGHWHRGSRDLGTGASCCPTGIDHLCRPP